MYKTRGGSGGLVLIGIVIVAVFIGIVVTFAIANVRKSEGCATRRITIAVLDSVGGQIELFKLDHNRNPDALEDLLAAPPYVDIKKYPPNAYLRELPTDGWNNKLVYRRGKGTGGPFELISYGRDGMEGGKGLDGDILHLGLPAPPFSTRVVVRSDQAALKTTKTLLASVGGQLDLFKLDHNRYPDALEDLLVAPNDVDIRKYPPEGYLKELPLDGWNNKLIYRRSSGTARPYELLSYGRDGKEGGGGFDADLVY